MQPSNVLLSNQSEKLAKKLSIKHQANWVGFENIVNIDNIDMPLFSGVWVTDPFEASGISGGSVLKAIDDHLIVSAPSTWTRLADLKHFHLVMHTPVQKEEIKALDVSDDKVNENLTLLKAKLVDFSLSEGGARLATIKLIEIEDGDVSVFSQIKKIIELRAKAYSMVPEEDKV